MGVQLGRDLLLKVDMTGDGAFSTVAGLRVTRFGLNAETVDVSSLQSGGWRELMAGGGMRSASISGSGVFRDEASDARLRSVFFEGQTPEFQIVLPGFGTMTGRFQIAALEYAGSYNGEATFEIALASAGVLLFVEEVTP